MADDVTTNLLNTISDIPSTTGNKKKTRKKKYDTEEERIKARKETMRKRDEARIYIRKESKRWQKMKSESCAKSDEEFMAAVLDWWEVRKKLHPAIYPDSSENVKSSRSLLIPFEENKGADADLSRALSMLSKVTDLPETHNTSKYVALSKQVESAMGLSDKPRYKSGKKSSHFPSKATALDTSKSSKQSSVTLEKSPGNLDTLDILPQSSGVDLNDSNCSTLSALSGDGPVYSDNNQQQHEDWNMNAKSYRDYNDCGDQFKTTVTTDTHHPVSENSTLLLSQTCKSRPMLTQSQAAKLLEPVEEALFGDFDEKDLRTIFSMAVDDSEEEHLLSTLYSYQQSAHLCDVTLISSDGVEFSAHAAVLAAASPDLEQKLCECPRGNYTAHMALSSTETENFIRFSYTGAQSTCADTLKIYAKKIISKLHMFSEKGLFCNMAWHRTMEEIQPAHTFLVTAQLNFLKDNIKKGSSVCVMSSYPMRSVRNTKQNNRKIKLKYANTTFNTQCDNQENGKLHLHDAYLCLYVCEDCKAVLIQKTNMMISERKDGKETFVCDLCQRGFMSGKITHVTVCPNNSVYRNHENTRRNDNKLQT